jgi:hypothetical protein
MVASFYISMLRDIPKVLRGTVEAWFFWIGSFVVPVAVFFNPELRAAMDSPEFSRWFVLMPIAVSIIYGLARANYARYRTLQSRIGPLVALLPHFDQAGRLVMSIRNDDHDDDIITARIERCSGGDDGYSGKAALPPFPADANWIDGYEGDRQTLRKGITRHIVLGSVPDRTNDDERPLFMLRAGYGDYSYPFRWEVTNTSVNPITLRVWLKSQLSGLSRHVFLSIVVVPRGKRDVVRRVYRDPVLDDQP